jgi:hypothetical protein
VDEATAIYKVAPTSKQTPDQGFWLTLDADGFSLPSDWYLRLTGEIGKMLRKEIPLSQKIPIEPEKEALPIKRENWLIKFLKKFSH